MPAVTIPNGEACGAPGPTGSPAVYCFFDYGDPNSRSDPLGLLAACQLGSSFQRIDGTSPTTFYYIKTAMPSAGAPNGTWVSK